MIYFFCGGNNYSKHFVSYSVCSELYSICLLTEYLSNGCLVSYLGSPGMGAFLPFTFLEVCWLSVLWSGTLIPEPGAHKGRQHSVQGCVSVSSALKQSTSECRIPCTGREPQEWWRQCWLHVPLVLPPELLCAKPAGCVCVFSTPQCCQPKHCPGGWSQGVELANVRSCPCLLSSTSLPEMTALHKEHQKHPNVLPEC